MSEWAHAMSRVREPEVSELREEVRKEESWRVRRLGDELDQLIKLVSWARESLQNELMDGLGYKKLGMSDTDLRKLKDLTATVNSAVESKIRYDKAQKGLAESMTPEEERAAVIAYVKSLEPDDYTELMSHLVRKK